jgi:hypothetical protein
VRSVITVASGKPFDYEDIAGTLPGLDIEDIATALCHSARFAGHTNRFHSVAAHAVTVYRILFGDGHEALDCYAGLHHDDHEAFLTDIPTPLKHMLEARAPGVYRGLVNEIDTQIARNLGIDAGDFHSKYVVAADQLALRLEAHVLKPNSQVPIGEWPLAVWEREYLDLVEDMGHDDARNTFLAIHYELASAAGGQRR